jgi:hypothetical protein
MDEELRKFIMVKQGLDPFAKKRKKLYTLLYKGEKQTGFIDREYPFIKWRYNQLINTGQKQKAFLEIRCTKSI